MTVFVKKPIRELCTVRREHVVPQANVEYTLYSLPAFDNSQKPELVDGKDIKSSKLAVESNIILFNKLNVKFRRVWNVHEMNDENAVCSTEFIPLKANQSILQDYLYYNLISDALTNTMDAARKGTSCSQQRIDVDALFSYEISVPPTAVQEKIVGILLNIDRKIKQNEAINHNLQQQAEALYKKTFPYSVRDELPDNWHIGTVRDIIDLHDSKRIPLSSRERDKMTMKIYPYYGATSVMDHVEAYIFDGCYLLLGEDGTVIDDYGHPILQYVWGKFWVNNHAHIISGKNGFMVESLYLFFKQLNVRSIVTGAVQPKISQANLCSVPVVIPPEEVIRAFNEQIMPFFTMIRTNTDENARLSSLRDSLLPRIMAGEIDVSDIDI